MIATLIRWFKALKKRFDRSNKYTVRRIEVRKHTQKNIHHVVKEEPSNEEILEKAYENAWFLFTEQKSFTEIALGPYITESYLPFDPYELMTYTKFKQVKEAMLEWYAETEEFEKCAFIRDYTFESYVELMDPFDMSGKLKS